VRGLGCRRCGAAGALGASPGRAGTEPGHKGDNTPSGSEDLGQSTSKKLIARAFSLQIIFRALGMLATIATVTATTRYLGTSSYGALTTAIVFVALWTSLTELGIGAVVVRLVMSGNGSLERLVRVNAGMSLVLSLPLFAVAAVSGVVIYHNQHDIAEMISIISAGLILTTVSSCVQPVFVATLRFTAVAVSDFLSKLASMALTMVLVEYRANLEWFAVVQLVPPIVVLLIQGGAASRIVNWQPVFSLQESWRLLRESLPQTTILIIAILYWRVDGFILSLRSTQDEVGVYGLAYNLAFTLSVLGTFFGTSTLSAMTHLYATDRARFGNFVARSVETMLFVGMPVAVVGTVLAPQMVGVVGSADFVDRGGPTLALLLVAAAISFVNGILSQAIFAAHDQVFLMRLNIWNLLVNILLNVILAPRYGAIGAGVAMIVAECTGLIVVNWRLGALTPYRTPWRFAFRLIFPLAACSALSVFGGDLSVLIVIPLASIVYLVVNLLFGPVTLKKMREVFSDSYRASGSSSEPDAGKQDHH
jgi:O-antigen/teichoic acid export membrane protein